VTAFRRHCLLSYGAEGVTICTMRNSILSAFVLMSLSAAPFAAAQINLPRLEAPKEDVPEFLKDETDYSRLSETEEKAARLEKLFKKLSDEQEEEQAGLIAEEIWALWTRSGSASVDLTLRRATQAQGIGDIKTARRMFDHVTTLAPDYAEGWTRSGRLRALTNLLAGSLKETAVHFRP